MTSGSFGGPGDVRAIGEGVSCARELAAGAPVVLARVESGEVVWGEAPQSSGKISRRGAGGDEGRWDSWTLAGEGALELLGSGGQGNGCSGLDEGGE